MGGLESGWEDGEGEEFGEEQVFDLVGGDQAQEGQGVVPAGVEGAAQPRLQALVPSQGDVLHQQEDQVEQVRAGHSSQGQPVGQLHGVLAQHLVVEEQKAEGCPLQQPPEGVEGPGEVGALVLELGHEAGHSDETGCYCEGDWESGGGGEGFGEGSGGGVYGCGVGCIGWGRAVEAGSAGGVDHVIGGAGGHAGPLHQQLGEEAGGAVVWGVARDAVEVGAGWADAVDVDDGPGGRAGTHAGWQVEVVVCRAGRTGEVRGAGRAAARTLLAESA